MRKFLFPVCLLILTLACSIPGIPAAELTPQPTFDADAPGTVIAQTAGAAQTQTALKLPTSTATPGPTRTPSITPTFTPTFLWGLRTSTPIPTFTPPHSNSGGEGDGEEGEENKDEDPRKFTGKPWSCVVVGTSPRRELVVNPQVRFVVEFTIFNAGTSAWGYNDLDFIWKSGFRNEETKVQDFQATVPSGGEVKLYATFIAPKKAGDYQSFFHLKVGRRDFCGMYYIFSVIEK
ncbi:MAG: hypothetical protein IPG44_11035 [Anaerolineales bacterium]|nr:hypothetical protein [Anaerolineales bacterium]